MNEVAKELEELRSEIEHKKEHYKRGSDCDITYGLNIALDAIDKRIEDIKNGK